MVFCIDLSVFEYMLHNYRAELERIWEKGGKKGGRGMLEGIIKNDGEKNRLGDRKKRVREKGS